MRYFNTHYNTFDEGTCLTNGYYLTKGSLIKYLPELKGNKLYILYEFRRNALQNIEDVMSVFRRIEVIVDKKKEIIDTKCFSNRSIGTPSILLKDKNDATEVSCGTRTTQWHRVLNIYDFEKGTVSLYLNGRLRGTGKNALAETPTYVEFRLPYVNEGDSISIRNIVISDEEIKPNQYLREAPLEVIQKGYETYKSVKFTNASSQSFYNINPNNFPKYEKPVEMQVVLEDVVCNKGLKNVEISTDIVKEYDALKDVKSGNIISDSFPYSDSITVKIK